jgi:hypothetical protein
LEISATLILFYIGHHSFQAIRQTGNCKAFIFFCIAIAIWNNLPNEMCRPLLVVIYLDV